MPSTLKIMGDRQHLETVLSPWPTIEVRGGHTVLEYDPKVKEARQQAVDVFSKLVTTHRFTALDTTVREAPTRIAGASNFNPEVQTEVVLIPQMAGGCY